MNLFVVNKKDPRLMTPDNFKYVGKPMLISQNAKIAIRHFINQHYPDIGKHADFKDNPIPWMTFTNPDHIRALEEGAHVFFYRAGGAGDLLMIAPLLQSLKKRYPKVEITFATDKKFHGIARMLPCIDHIESFPIIEDTYKKFDMYSSFYETIELHSNKSRTMHGVDLFADHIGWEWAEDDEKVAKLELTKKGQKRIDKLFVRDKVPAGADIVVVQFRASNVNRAFDLTKMADVIGKIGSRPNTHVFVVGGKPEECHFAWKNEDGSPMASIHKVLGELQWHETAALVSRANICIAPDSALVHIAGSMGIPCVGLYGPFPSEIRTIYYPEAIAVEAEAKCAPCFAHGSWPCTHLSKRLDDMTDKKGNKPIWAPAPCWDSVKVEDVLAPVARILDHENESNEEDQCPHEES